jgi:hypothetical protein
MKTRARAWRHEARPWIEFPLSDSGDRHRGLILKATLLRVEVIALLGFDNGRETPDEENSKNNIRRGVENEREKEGCRKDSKDQDWKDGVREHLSERSPDGVGATSHRQGRLNGDSASICLGRVVVAQN